MVGLSEGCRDGNEALAISGVRKTSDYDHIKLDLNHYNYFYDVHYLEYCMCIIWNMRTHNFSPDNNNVNDCSKKFGLSFVTIWRCEQEFFIVYNDVRTTTKAHWTG